MNQLKIANAYFIKLGEGGEWEESSISENKMRIGWRDIPLSDIHNNNWRAIEQQIRSWSNLQEKKGAATADINALKKICKSTPRNIWITFHKSCLWWCRLADGKIMQDKTSRYREVDGRWRNENLKGELLSISRIPGQLSQIQGFRGTVCDVKEKKILVRLINGIQSPIYKKTQQARNNLIEKVEKAIKGLHWKNFETLVDLIYRQAGWKRVSWLGQTMKYADLELEEPITRELYQVQVKSSADLNDFRNYARQFPGRGFRKLYFIVHTPSQNLIKYKSNKEDVELVLPNRLAEMVVDAGLVSWVMDKVR